MPRTGFIRQYCWVSVGASYAPDQPVALKLPISMPWLLLEPAASKALRRAQEDAPVVGSVRLLRGVALSV